MRHIICLIVFNNLILCSVISTNHDFRCPENSEGHLREKVVCMSDVNSSYVCLYDDNNNHFTEFCTKQLVYLAPGFKYVLRGGFDGEPCEDSRFQPFKFWTISGKECILLKSKCEEEGQIVYWYGSTTSDTTCRCDFSKGYAFVASPVNNCFCDPSFEDCSCYKKECNENYILSPDYNCTHSKSSQICQTRCSAYMKFGFYSVKPTPPIGRITDHAKEDIQTTYRLYTPSAVTLTVIVIIIILIIVVLTCDKKTKSPDNVIVMPTCDKKTKPPENVSKNYIRNEQQSNSNYADAMNEIKDVVLDIVQKSREYVVLIIVGDQHFGKTTAAINTAFVLYGTEQYMTFYCKNQEELEENLAKDCEKKTLVFDDYFTSNEQHRITKWRVLYDNLNNLKIQNNVKIIITCLPSYLDQRGPKFSSEYIYPLNKCITC